MGLLLSILVGCVGVIELIDLLKCKDNEITLKSPACLSYHESDTTENLSFHDSICGLSHSSSLNLSKSARCKLENLHEYSLKVRSELRSRGYDDACTLSDFSCRDIFGMSRPDSRASLDFDLPHDDDDDDENDEKHSTYSINVDNKNDKSINNNYEINKISINELQDKLQSSNSSIDLTTSFDNDDSENELTNNNNKNTSSSTSPQSSTEPIHKCCIKNIKLSTTNYDGDTLVLIQDKNINKNCNKLTMNNDRKLIKKSTSILRKPTRLKSRNADISKSAENIVYNNSNKLTKRQRNPERRKSDISVQTNNQYHDESTNTISNDFNETISTSRQSISVEVQTNFNDYNNTLFNELLLPKTGLKKEFINKYDKFIKSRSLDDCIIDYYYDKNLENNLPGISVRNISLFDRDNELYNWNLTKKINSKSCLKISNSQTMNTKTMTKTMHENEDDSIDEEFLDAVEMVTCEPGSINDCINSSNKNDKNTRLIFSGEYTKAMNKDWHSGHFCCWQCDESLTGQRYVLRDEHPYCINCYESVFANNCEECGKIIGIDSKVNSCKDLSYKDKHWHEACFLCFKCRVSLVEKQFGSKGDKIYCGNCYDTQFASRCDGCGEIFRAGTKKMEYKTRQWHEKCFCCVVCKNAIGLKSFIPREQEIYCAGCYEDKFATRCIKCNKIITSGGVTYKNDPWHRECFTCTNCDNCLAGQRFTSRDEKPYCAECFGELFAKRCTSCTKPITGIGGTRFISFEDRHWHNDCFICAGCKSSLVGRGFITDADDIICPECAKVKLTTE